MVLNSDLNSLINNPLFGSNSCSKNEDELENKNESEEILNPNFSFYTDIPFSSGYFLSKACFGNLFTSSCFCRH